MTRSVSARLAAGLAPVRVRVAPRPLPAPEAESPDVSEPARPDANRGAHVAPELAEVGDLVAFAAQLEVTAALARKVSESLETRLATSAGQSVHARVPKTSRTNATARAATHARNAQDELLDANELAAQLALDVRTVRRMSREGRIPSAIRIGGSLRWRRADITAWLSKGGSR